MALIKSIQYKGFTVEYWNIVNVAENKETNKTRIIIVPYVSKNLRLENIANGIHELEMTIDLDGFGDSLNELYVKLKQSNPTPISTANNGTEFYEGNFFANATDDV
jgi:hypothetical protein